MGRPRGVRRGPDRGLRAAAAGYASKIVRAAPVTIVGLDISRSMVERRAEDVARRERGRRHGGPPVRRRLLDAALFVGALHRAGSARRCGRPFESCGPVGGSSPPAVLICESTEQAWRRCRADHEFRFSSFLTGCMRDRLRVDDIAGKRTVLRFATRAAPAVLAAFRRADRLDHSAPSRGIRASPSWRDPCRVARLALSSRLAPVKVFRATSVRDPGLHVTDITDGVRRSSPSRESPTGSAPSSPHTTCCIRVNEFERHVRGLRQCCAGCPDTYYATTGTAAPRTSARRHGGRERPLALHVDDPRLRQQVNPVADGSSACQWRRVLFIELDRERDRRVGGRRLLRRIRAGLGASNRMSFLLILFVCSRSRDLPDRDLPGASGTAATCARSSSGSRRSMAGSVEDEPSRDRAEPKPRARCASFSVGPNPDPQRAQQALSTLSAAERRAYLDAVADQGAMPEAANREQRRRQQRVAPQAQPAKPKSGSPSKRGNSKKR